MTLTPMYNALMIRDLQNQMDKLVWGEGLQQYGLPGRILTAVLRNLYAVLRDIVSGQLTLRSMSLVYTTLLSIVPLIAFSFSVLKGLGVHKELEKRLYTILEPLGDKGVEITDQLMTLVNNVNGSVLGGIGLAFFIYTAISMVQKIEESFNYVWYVTKSRSFARRFTEYMLVLLIGPVVIVIALGMITSLQNDSIVQTLVENNVLGPVFVATSKLTPYVLVTGVFTFLYMYMPNTRVRFRSALVGGVAGGFLWATVGVVFAAFLANSAQAQAIYASFAIAITTLIWLYLNWLILLIGAQLAFYFQNPAYLRIGRREPRLSNAMRERLALNVMLIVGSAFRDPDKTINLAMLSEKLRIPSITVAPITNALENRALLTTNEKEELLPGREMSRILLVDILDVVRVDGETGSYRDPKWSSTIETLGGDVDAAVEKTLSGRSLSDLLDELEK
ncbi:MAG: YihY/virulence factor BrkB family protein [Gammaproteobacteria bacterium]|nr:YihY/virulence factor BrkB family protein [Gammaproteobacteria bacterium]